MRSRRAQFEALYLTRFAASFGFVTLATLLPEYIDLFEPSGVVIGLFTTALTLSQTVAVIPLAWAGDRYDKRPVLLVGGLAALTGVATLLDTLVYSHGPRALAEW